MATKDKYIPGVCNIGPAERRRRRLQGIGALLVAVVWLAFLLVIHAPWGWRVLLIIPIAGAATGFLQDYYHFCAGFGIKGIYNVINSAGITDDVEMEEYRLKDRRKALQILYMSLATGIILTGIIVLI